MTDTQDASIRLATTDDIAAIQAVAEVTFRHTYREILSPEQMEYMMRWMYATDSLQRQMLSEGHRYYLLEADGRTLGYVSIQPQQDGVVHLQKIYLLPTEQGHGYGEMLFRRALREAKALNGGRETLVELNVNRNNRAVGFYQRMGMVKLRQGDFPIGNGFYMNDYIMGITV